MRCSEMREEELRELVLEVLEGFKDRVYKCSDVSECIDELVRELGEELKRATSGYCFIEAYDDCGVNNIACGLLETFYVTIDYDVEEAVRVKGFKVEAASSTIKYEVKKLVAVALGKLIGREFKSRGWLKQLVDEFNEELRKINSECRVKLCGVSYNVDHDNFAEILVYCNEQGSVLVRIYVDFIEYVRVLDAKIE
jgi:hypothetical protein